MKRLITTVMALALVLSLSQCKKNEQNIAENQGEVVTITLDVRGTSTGSATDGSRVVVNPNTGTVDFENNDQIIVASGGKYVGTLTYNGTLFTGAISNATEGYPLQFYFLGNVTPAETLTSGVTESCSVVISDQTEHLPVISAAPSNENYTASMTDYTAHLLNKCALVKFNVTTSSEAATCITGMKNKVTVNFADNTLAHSQEGNGVITLPAGNGEKWAILLPQESLDESGSAYSRDGDYIGTRGTVPAIVENGYLTLGIDVVLISGSGFGFVDLGLPSGLLWARCNIGADSPEKYGDYFAWGETQSKDYYGWSTYQYCNGVENTLTKYCNNPSYGYNGFTDTLTILQPIDDAAMVNWGVNWRIPTKEEWEELNDNTTFIWTTQSGVYGRLFIASNGNSLFLPAAGGYDGSGLSFGGSNGYYWSSSLSSRPDVAKSFHFGSSGNNNFTYYGKYRYFGFSVRAVYSPLQN